jgi:hypothetical protein
LNSSSVTGVPERQSRWTRSIIAANEPTFYLVADDLGQTGSAWRESDLKTADLETVIQNMIAGAYRRPIKVIAFNTAAVPKNL